MSRSLTDSEKNQVKNLQVSNSIYRNDIKKLLVAIKELETNRDQMEAKLADAMGDEYNKIESDLEKVNGDIKLKIGKIAYIEGRISEKERRIEEIKNTAAREEEQVVRVWDPNSPECQAKFGAAMEELEKKAPTKKTSKSKSSKPAGDPTQDF